MEGNAMTFDPTKPVQTRDGREARIICTDAKGDYPIIALVGPDEILRFYDSGGKSYYYSENDLINIPEKRVVWFNVYNDKFGHETKEDADTNCSSDRIACVRVEYEVGEGL